MYRRSHIVYQIEYAEKRNGRMKDVGTKVKFTLRKESFEGSSPKKVKAARTYLRRQDYTGWIAVQRSQRGFFCALLLDAPWSPWRLTVVCILSKRPIYLRGHCQLARTERGAENLGGHTVMAYTPARQFGSAGKSYRYYDREEPVFNSTESLQSTSWSVCFKAVDNPDAELCLPLLPRILPAFHVINFQSSVGAVPPRLAKVDKAQSRKIDPLDPTQITSRAQANQCSMSERGQHTGRGGRGGGRGSAENRGGRGGGRGGHNSQQSQTERPKKENILDLGKYMDKQITVKFNGGREGAFVYRVFLGS